jgi:hypothetical protein
MSQRIHGIIGRIGSDSPNLDTPNGYECIITAQYPDLSSNKSDGNIIEIRTVFDKDNILVYTWNQNGGIVKSHPLELPPEEYVFDATVTMLAPNFAKAADIVIKSVKK